MPKKLSLKSQRELSSALASNKGSIPESSLDNPQGSSENDRLNNYVSKTDWDRVKRDIASDAPIPYDPEDGPYDPNDEAAVNAYWDEGERLGLVTRGLGKRGPQKAPKKQLISLRLSKEVLDHFRATGPGWQARIDEILRQATSIKSPSI